MRLIRQLKNLLYYIYANIYTKASYFLPGIILFFILFLISGLMNFGFSYMGNKSDKIADTLTRYYLLTIIFQLLKILLVYIITGALLSGIFYPAIKEAQRRFKIFKKNESVSISVLTFLCLLFYVFLFFSKSLIRNPQPYVENFAAHLMIFKRYQDFLTDNINPAVFDFFTSLLMLLILSFILISLDWSALLKFKNIKAFSVQYKNIKARIVFIIVLIIAVLYFLYDRNIIFYNRPGNLPNILIISADALRPDHMSFNGYKKKTTPNIDNVSGDSLQIRRTFTPLPRTFPAWVSVLTSKYPLTHGINHMFPRTRDRNIKFETAVRYLNERGYNTAVISDFAGDIFPRIDLGFKKVSAPDLNTTVLIKQALLEKQTFLLPFIANKAGLFIFPEMREIAKLSFPRLLTEETIDEIESSRGKPFFILTFYSITHFPFSPSYPYYKKYASPGYDGPYKYFKDRILNLGKEDNILQQDIRREDKEQVNALYDGCLNQFDTEAGRIIDFLKKKKLLEDTIIVVTSDHGENLYEKDFGMGHGEHLKGNYSLEVPLIIYSSKLNDLRGKTVEMTSSSIDIMPTVFDIAGIAIPGYFDGRSIVKILNQKKADDRINSHRDGLKPIPMRIDPVDAYCETGIWFDNDKSSPLFFHHQRIDYPDISGISEIDFTYRDEVVIAQKYQNIVSGAKYRAIYSGRYKLIYIPLSDGARFELYDFLSDPDNKNDLSAARKDVLDIMKKRFYSFIDEKSSGNFIIKNDMLFPAFADPVF